MEWLRKNHSDLIKMITHESEQAVSSSNVPYDNLGPYM